MIQLLRKMSFEGNRGLRGGMLLLLVCLLGVFDTAAQNSSLPITHPGKWLTSTDLPAGWTQSGLSSQGFANLNTNTTTNPNSSGVATFADVNDVLQININAGDTPEKITFLYNAKSSTASFSGRFIIEEATSSGGTYTAADSITSFSGTGFNTSYSKAVLLKSTTKSIRLSLKGTANTSNPINIDLVSISKVSSSPEIEVFQNGKSISSGGTYTFSLTQNTNTVSESVEFKVFNTGLSTLTVDSIKLTGTDASQFEIVDFPASSVAPSQSDSLSIVFKPTSIGTKTAAIQIYNTDSDENPYQINISATSQVFQAVIDSFTQQGGIGDTVTIRGSNLINTNNVIFNGVAGDASDNINGTNLSVLSDTLITVVVPVNAKTGKLTVQNGTNTQTSTDFIVIPAPIITSISTDSAQVGDLIIIEGSDLDNLENVKINGAIAVVTNASSMQLTAEVPAGATLGLGEIIVTTVGGSDQIPFTVLASDPYITSFTPDSASVGDLVTVTGANFPEVSGLAFFDENGGELFAEEIIVNEEGTEISGLVPAGAVTGRLRIFNENFEVIATSDTDIVIFVPAPTITSLSDSSGAVGDYVTIYGTNFTDVQSVNFNGTTATYAVISAGEIQAQVPTGATTGPLAVTTLGGSDQATYTVQYPAPTITSLSDSSGMVGDYISIFGTNLTNIQSVTFNNIETTVIDSVSIGELRVRVPDFVPASTGPLVVTTSSGSAQTDFTVSYLNPDITAVTPNTARGGEFVTIKGSNFQGITSITFNGTGGTGWNTNSDYTEVTVSVPMEAEPGEGTMVLSSMGGSAQEAFIVQEPVPLPVELVNFTATKTKSGVNLTWQTASERDNAYFEVQSTTDLKSSQFEALGQVKSKVTNSATLTSYEFKDATQKSGTIYYRLKQVDLDGQSEYSKVVAVTSKPIAKGSQFINAYPNPFTKEIQLEIAAERAGTLSVTLYYVTGKKAFETTVSVESGKTTVPIEVSNSLPQGVYILSTELNGEVSTKRFIKQ